ASHRRDVGPQGLHHDRQLDAELFEPGRRAHFGRFRYATCCSPVGPGSTETSSQPSAPHWSRICLVAWVNSGTVAYSQVVGWLISRAYRQPVSGSWCPATMRAVRAAREGAGQTMASMQGWG